MVAKNEANTHVFMLYEFMIRLSVFQQILALVFNESILYPYKIGCVLLPILGRELFVLIVTRQSRPSRDKCIQLHAFFYFKYGLDGECNNESKNLIGFYSCSSLEN